MNQSKSFHYEKKDSKTPKAPSGTSIDCIDDKYQTIDQLH